MDFHFTIQSDGGTSSRARVGRHELKFDMPRTLGGEGKGPGPLAYFVVSAGACFHYAAARVLTEQGLSSDGIEVHIHTTMSPDRRVDSMRLEVELPPGTSETTRLAVDAKLRDCPIHNTLVRPPPLAIETNVQP